jgi:protein tyrosine/serine phosphatase
VRGIAVAPLGGVVVHCHAGKDRTGVVIAVLLSLVGVPDETIAADYALSADQIVPLTREWLDRVTRSDDERAALLQRAMPRPQIILDTLAHLRDRHGGAERYLLDAGVSAEELTVLRDRLLEPTRAA